LGYLILLLSKHEKFYIWIFQGLVFSGIVVIFRVFLTVSIGELFNTRLGYQVNLNPTDFGNKFAFLSMLTIYGLFAFKNYRASNLFLTVLFIFFTLLSGSRKSILAISIFVIVLFITRKLSLKNFFKYAISAFLFLFILYYIVFEIPSIYQLIGVRIDQLLNYFSSNGIVDNSTYTRIAMLEKGFQLISEKPIIGWGIHSFSFLTTHAYSHNNFVEITVGLGLIGFTVYYWLYLTIALRLYKRRKLITNYPLYISLLVTLIFIETGQVTYYTEIYISLIAVLYSVAYRKTVIYND
ncbi:MAG: O-antigen ligase family protein, partial [Acholeplasmataceae bacterium]|nr:O-antigen ligase family protein [Acholeplasmataceae bacterium]